MVNSELRRIEHKGSELTLDEKRVIIARVFYANNGKVVAYIPMSRKSACSEIGIYESWAEEDARLFFNEMQEALNNRVLTEEDFI